MDTNTTTPTYTEQDLRDAMYTHFVDIDVATEEGAPDPAVTQKSTDRQKVWFHESGYTPLDLSNPEDRAYFSEEYIPKQVAQYQRGKEILETCKIISSSRSVVCGDNLYDEMAEGETVVSPALRWFSGHIATSEAYRWIALALRKTGQKKEEPGDEG